MTKKNKVTHTYLLLVSILAVSAIAVGCRLPGRRDMIAPTVILAIPSDTATGVAINSTITATFSEEMNPLSITADTFIVVQGTTAVAGTVTMSYGDLTATFTPASDLAASTSYTVTITTVVQDDAGNALESAYVWAFTTGTAADTTAPTVISTVPADAATGVAIDGPIRATFSEPMSAASIVAANFTVAAGLIPVKGTVTYDLPNKTAVFAPTGNLIVGTAYTVTVTTRVMDLTGNPLAADMTWTFTTASRGLGPAPVRLGTAGNFAILAKTAVTNVPASAITGDIGLSPAAESYYTGFSQTDATGYATSPQVTGFLYAADMTGPTPSNMTTAISDMETAYTDAAGRPRPDFTNLGGGTLSGLTLAPGLYTWGTSVNITTDITIAGSALDVWIFQMSGDLIVSSAVNVILSGGAQAKNIFWQLAGQATLGTTSHFEGTILSQTAINFRTGASLNGRALAQSQVVLDQNTVTEPTH